MGKFKNLQEIKKLYQNGENIIQYLRTIDNENFNTIEDILISYDFQSGSYIKSYSKNKEFKNNYCSALAKIINKFDNYNSIIEVGIGEATTLGILLNKLTHKPSHILGFDISWSRLKFAKYFLHDLNFNNVNLFTGNLFEIPLPENSIDVVYTSHSIEPNGGKEELALKELYRITNKYLVLLEPAYEFANEEAKTRMRKHGYITKLFPTAKKLGYNIIEHRLFDYSVNSSNPTGLIIIKKETDKNNFTNLVCPVTKTNLTKYDNILFSKDSFLAYPIIDDIPCLLKENAILATHFLTDYSDFKKDNEINI